MKRCALLALVLLTCVLALGATDARADSAKPFQVHFTVVPATMPDGSDAGPALEQFKAEVIKLAGGFTELGPSHGGSLRPDGMHQSNNIAFLIGADKDLSAELKALTLRLFGETNVFILVWPGTVTF
ncbi:MAG: hypothetical protein KUA35_04510 [Pseudodesulfovibrio sp.]|uniref:DUF3574 domain-containing protein n=1 Tax=Pseudodesulfovibrio aespoeensis (strain ATCC 700646 / DSM 10631 / Aspo-2) TaxID=643562 RepID=E6VSS0_PSEA9|nr:MULTISPECIES: hypothetical protein [Pseudodesulfovibrio]MBU4192103.1 hypothetical protein [Pseudomonadota bacterium]ADU63164.1 hypothetical protein Daes_2158 [Pseudodesulfovibrio aespoeensis Aspo-2]MBU4244359.1 hypothetical protein [Pseudomonadota bacterium]MBU4377650.1 hypothetical protein [Pseudomonadota bacterium]MBU4475961.1 hypothetical protein [Pseudomonadota bacterium]